MTLAMIGYVYIHLHAHNIFIYEVLQASLLCDSRVKQPKGKKLVRIFYSDVIVWLLPQGEVTDENKALCHAPVSPRYLKRCNTGGGTYTAGTRAVKGCLTATVAHSTSIRQQA